MAHVAEYKKKIVEDIVGLANQYSIIGVVNMENLPAPQLQKMRAQLRDRIRFAMTKKRIIKRALEQVKTSKNGVEQLNNYFTGMPALIFTNESPFKLFRMLKRNKSPAPAKAGQTAPKDITVPAGPTSFAPGPIIGELAQIGIKSGVEGGKVAVKQDSIVAKKGEKIKPKVAEILTRLGIEPMEVGLDIVAAYENGIIYPKEILDVDEEEFMANLKSSASRAFNLAVYIAYPAKDTIKHLIAKAFNESKAIGLSRNIIDDVIINELLSKAQRQMLILSSTAKIEVKEKPREAEKKETDAQKKSEEAEEEKIEGQRKQAEQKKAEEEKRKAEEQKKAAEERQSQEHTRRQEQARKAEEERKAAEQKRLEEENKKAEEQKKAEEETKRQEELRIQEEQRKAEEQKKSEKKEAEKKEDETDIKVREIVEKTKRIAEPKPSAVQLVEEIKRETRPAKADKIQTEMSKAQELLRELQKKGTLRDTITIPEERKKPRVLQSAETEQKKVESLFEKLKRKGTLRE